MRYGHQHGAARIDWDERGGQVALVLKVARRQDETGDWLAYPEAFPDQAGIGASEEEAQRSLDEVFGTWLRLFIEHNGPEEFLHELERYGFRPVPEAIMPIDIESAELFQAPVPPCHTRSSARSTD